MGAVFLFAEAVAAEPMRQLWALGPSFDWAQERGDPSASSGGGYEGLAPTMASLLLALNPKSRDGDDFPNNAAVGDNETALASSFIVREPAAAAAVRGGAAQSASLSVGSHACVTHTVRDSAHCLGGVQLLFPLLARLPGDDTSESAGGGGTPGGGTPGGGKAEQVFVQLLGLMSQMLADSAADQHFMLRRHGFAIFVFLLRQLPPIVWSVQAVTACVHLTSCFASSEALHHEAVWLLFGAPRLWIFTALEVQLKVYEVRNGPIHPPTKPLAFCTPLSSLSASIQCLLAHPTPFALHRSSRASSSSSRAPSSPRR